MRLIRTADYKQMSLLAADLIAAQVLSKPGSVLGLATGASPEGVYEELAARYAQGRLDFSQVHAVNLDEYAGLPATHTQSYAHFMQRMLLSKINVQADRTHIPNGMAQDGPAECVRYDRLIESLGGIDLQLLGIGSNGHIGFNEPADSFPGATHYVALTERTRADNSRYFASPEEVPTHAFTMGVRPIMCARRVVMLASGKGKAPAVKAALYGEITPRVPASILQLHPDFILVADGDALSMI